MGHSFRRFVRGYPVAAPLTVAGRLPPVSGRTALVTGASRGLGRETARQLGLQGYRVILGARGGKGDATAEELRGEGIDAQPLELDVAAPDTEVLRALEVDVLVNNAGVALDPG